MEIGKGLRRQSLALVSLLVALGALGHNWRDLGQDDGQAATAIDGAINALRTDVTAALAGLQ